MKIYTIFNKNLPIIPIIGISLGLSSCITINPSTSGDYESDGVYYSASKDGALRAQQRKIDSLEHELAYQKVQTENVYNQQQYTQEKEDSYEHPRVGSGYFDENGNGVEESYYTKKEEDQRYIKYNGSKIIIETDNNNASDFGTNDGVVVNINNWGNPYWAWNNYYSYGYYPYWRDPFWGWNSGWYIGYNSWSGWNFGFSWGSGYYGPNWGYGGYYPYYPGWGGYYPGCGGYYPGCGGYYPGYPIAYQPYKYGTHRRYQAAANYRPNYRSDNNQGTHYGQTRPNYRNPNNTQNSVNGSTRPSYRNPNNTQNGVNGSTRPSYRNPNNTTANTNTSPELNGSRPSYRNPETNTQNTPRSQRTEQSRPNYRQNSSGQTTSRNVEPRPNYRSSSNSSSSNPSYRSSGNSGSSYGGGSSSSSGGYRSSGSSSSGGGYRSSGRR